MRIQLPDVNVLLPLFNVSHAHHQIAKQWFESEGKFGWATCPLTENGFLRLTTQALKGQQTGEFEDALFLLETAKQIHKATHHFCNDDVSYSNTNLFAPKNVRGHQQVTDVYLLGLCQQKDGTLVTMDQRITTDAIINPYSELLKILS